MDHFVFLGDKASVDVARRFLHACNVSFQALAHMPELGTQRSFRNPRFSSVRAWPVKGFERYLIFYRPLTDGVEIPGSSTAPETSNAFFVRVS